MASAHLLGESADAVGVLSSGAEVFAGDEPGGAVAGAGCLDVGGLLAGLPSAGDDERACDGYALGAVDVLGVAESQAREILLALEDALAAGDIEVDEHLASWGDVEDLSAAAVLDALLAGLAVLVDERDPVAPADAVVDTGDRDLVIAEFAALRTEVLCARVQTVDLLV